MPKEKWTALEICKPPVPSIPKGYWLDLDQWNTHNYQKSDVTLQDEVLCGTETAEKSCACPRDEGPQHRHLRGMCNIYSAQSQGTFDGSGSSEAPLLHLRKKRPISPLWRREENNNSPSVVQYGALYWRLKDTLYWDRKLLWNHIFA